MTLQIEAGKYYRTRDGRKVGPMWEYAEGGFYAADGYAVVWSERGQSNCPYTPDIIAEWTDERASAPQPKLWRDMTPEEKGALLLAHHGGRTIERWVDESLGWKIVPPMWMLEHAYRVSPEPKRETVVLYAGDTTIGKIDLIDGKPDPDSIRMELI